jgi:hypothetical protein
MLAGSVFAGGLIYLLWRDAPGGWFYRIQVSCLVSLTVALVGVLLYWTAFPDKHPVNRALAMYGDVTAIAKQLNDEMAEKHEVQGPFLFTSSFLTYSPGYTLDLVRYDDILAAIKGDEPNCIEVHTKRGKVYTWNRTLIQGTFSPEKVLLSIKRRANLVPK